MKLTPELAILPEIRLISFPELVEQEVPIEDMRMG